MPGVLINAPQQEVWDKVSDLTAHTQWSDHEKTEAVGSDPVGVGSKFTSALPDEEPDQLEITEFKPPNKIAYHSVMRNGLEFDFEMKLEARGDSTHLSRTGKMVKGPFYIKPLVNMVIGPMGEGKYSKLIKATLESNG